MPETCANAMRSAQYEACLRSDRQHIRAGSMPQSCNKAMHPRRTESSSWSCLQV